MWWFSGSSDAVEEKAVAAMSAIASGVGVGQALRELRTAVCDLVIDDYRKMAYLGRLDELIAVAQ